MNQLNETFHMNVYFPCDAINMFGSNCNDENYFQREAIIII